MARGSQFYLSPHDDLRTPALNSFLGFRLTVSIDAVLEFRLQTPTLSSLPDKFGLR